MKKYIYVILVIAIVYTGLFLRFPRFDIQKSTFVVQCTNSETFGFFAQDVLTYKNIQPADPNVSAKDLSFKFINPEVETGTKLICNMNTYPSDVDSFYSTITTNPSYLTGEALPVNYRIVTHDVGYTPSYGEEFARVFGLIVVLFVGFIGMVLFWK